MAKQAHLSQGLDLSLRKLALGNQALSLVLEDLLNLLRVLLVVQLACQRSELLVVDLGNDEISVVQSAVDLGRRSSTTGVEVVGVLDGTTHHTLVLFRGVLGGLLCLFAISLLSFLSSLLLSSRLGFLFLLLSSLLCDTLLLGLLLQLLLVLGGVGLLAEELDTLVKGKRVVDEMPEAGSVFRLLLATGSGILALDVTLLVAVLVVVGHILVQVFKGSPAVEVVPEVVEVLDILLRALRIAELGNGLVVGETALGLKDFTPELVEVALLRGLLRRWLDFSALIDGVELPPSYRVRKHLGGFLDALEELVALIATSCSLLVRVMLEDLPAVGALDLVLSRTPSVAGYAENSVVILGLYRN
jgi:hypothetical protein